MGKKYSYDLERDGVTQSMLTAFLSCPTKTKLGTVEGWSSSRPRRALSYGSLMHKVLEDEQRIQKEKGKDWTPSDLRVRTTIDDACKVFRKKANEKGRFSPEDEEQLELTKAQLYAIMPAYFRHWDAPKWTEIENVFDIPYKVGTSLTTRLRGRKDGVFTAKDGTLWQLDSKSSSRINEEELGVTLTRNYQILFYTLATYLQTGKIPKRFVYNIVRKTGLKPKGGDLPEYVKRIGDEVAKNPDHFFHRFEVAIVKQDLLDFQKELDQTLLHIKAWVEAGMPSPKFGMPCQGMYGLCNYAAICYEDDYSQYKTREHVFAELVDEED